MLTVQISAEQDDSPIPYSYDPEVKRGIERAIVTNPTWGWAVVIVKVCYGPLEAEEVLGGVCQDSISSFISESGYLEDMLEACVLSIYYQLRQVLQLCKATHYELPCTLYEQALKLLKEEELDGLLRLGAGREVYTWQLKEEELLV